MANNDLTKIVMPLEHEGAKSVVRAWLCEIGQHIERDQPIVEIETDKVAVEIVAPDSGVLHRIDLAPGDDAPPGATLGLLRIDAAGAVPDHGSAISNSGAKAALSGSPDSLQALGSPSMDGGGEQRLSPLVKRMLEDNAIAAAQIAGTGGRGRITNRDIEDFIAKRGKSPPAPKLASGARRIPHEPMRKAIAEHMAHSLAAAPHVTAVFEADFSAVINHRAQHKAAFEKAGAPLTFSAYIVRACVDAMSASPNVNSRWHDDHLDVFDDINIGIGVSLGEKGLIVPVIAQAQQLSLQESAKRLNDLTEKARAGKLAPSDVQNGTFTISNHGVSGSLLAAPIIINQPQSAILGVGKLEKRAVVREIAGADVIEIRPMAYVSLTIDHRVLDGHQTNAWLTRFVQTLESWPLEGETI